MVEIIEEAILAVQMDDIEGLMDALEEAEYIMQEESDKDFNTALELKELIGDVMIIARHRPDDSEGMLMYLFMTLDVLTVPVVDGYKFDEDKFDKYVNDLHEHTLNRPTGKGIQFIEWEMKFKRLSNELKQAIIEDHNNRFGDNSSLKEDAIWQLPHR